MDYDALVTFVQEQFTDGLALVIGSGLSAAEGIPGMLQLADHLKNSAGKLTGTDSTLWNKIKAVLDAGEGLESALLKYPPSEMLEVWIAKETCALLIPEERKVMQAVLCGKRILRLTAFLTKVLKPTNGLPILTPNYDRLIEVACEMAGFHVDTTAVGHYAGAFDHARSCMGSCRGITTRARSSVIEHFPRAIVLKPHGSFDWYRVGSDARRCALELDAERLIITPGLNKYRAGYNSPFDKHRELANDYIKQAGRLLVVGYGFNDDHLQTHLLKQIRDGTPTLILNRYVDDRIKMLAQTSPHCICLSQLSLSAGVAMTTKGCQWGSQGMRLMGFKRSGHGAIDMTDAPVLMFDAPSKLGKVASVDTSRVLIAVENARLLPRASVGSLVAIQGTTAQEFLIGMTERVTRQLIQQAAQPDPMAPTTLVVDIVPDDALRAVLLGTYRTIEGTVRNRFKRGADSFPQIDRDCFLIEGSNLQRFMGLLGKDLDETQRLELGHFAIDHSAAAIANGDRFFQRHAAILGSTGSGKSYAVSLILERANARKHVNIVVFDMHGEYASLANPPIGKDGATPKPIATAFRIAGPGDLAKPPENALFLPYWLLNREEMLSMILDRSDQNAPNQSAQFTTHVRELKDATLKVESQDVVRATFTVDSPIPYRLADLLDRLQADDKGTKIGANKTQIKGDWNGKLTRFISRLEAKAEDRRYGFMFKPPDVALDYKWLVEQVTKLLAPGEVDFGIKIVDFSQQFPAKIFPFINNMINPLSEGVFTDS